VENIQTLVSALQAKAAQVRIFFLSNQFWRQSFPWSNGRNTTEIRIVYLPQVVYLAVTVAAAWPAGSPASYLQSGSLQSSHNSVTKRAVIE
jgi:hypothetical protein